MARRIQGEADEGLDRREGGIVRAFDAADPMRLQAIGVADALDRPQRDVSRLGAPSRAGAAARVEDRRQPRIFVTRRCRRRSCQASAAALDALSARLAARAAASRIPLPLDGLADSFGLDAIDRDLLLVALAPDLDRRYGRVFGFLQDDATRRRPKTMGGLHAPHPHDRRFPHAGRDPAWRRCRLCRARAFRASRRQHQERGSGGRAPGHGGRRARHHGASRAGRAARVAKDGRPGRGESPGRSPPHVKARRHGLRRHARAGRHGPLRFAAHTIGPRC